MRKFMLEWSEAIFYAVVAMAMLAVFSGCTLDQRTDAQMKASYLYRKYKATNKADVIAMMQLVAEADRMSADNKYVTEEFWKIAKQDGATFNSFFGIPGYDGLPKRR